MAEKIFRLFAPFRVVGRAFVDWWDGWVDTFLLTITWLLAQLTIVLGPPATFGVYYVINRMVNHGEALGVRGMIQGARMNFGKAWLWGAINLLAVVVIYVNWNFYLSFQAGWVVYVLALIVLMAYLFVCTQFYTIPYYLEYSGQKLFVSMKNGMLTAMASPLFTFVLLVLSGVILVLSVVTVLPFFLGLPGLIPLFGVRGLQDRLVAYGLREREKSPRELEMEESARVHSSNLSRREAEQAQEEKSS